MAKRVSNKAITESSRSAADLPMSNASVIMSAIRKLETAARIDIAHMTSLSPATVTIITSDMLKAGLIEAVPGEAEAMQAKRGRPRVLLRIRGAARYVIGAKLADGRLILSLLNFAGDKIKEGEYPTPRWPLEATELPDLLLGLLTDFCTKSGVELARISGIGIGMPGLVDGPAGMVVWSRAFDQENIELRQLLGKKFTCPVFIDNDANLVALGELWFGYGKHTRDFITVTVEAGLGMGIVIDGALYRGSQRRGAEFGHTKVALDGALCRCGQRGCLEAYIADYALIREADQVVGETRKSIQRVDQLYAAAKSDNEAALEIFRRAGRMFGMGLANVVNIFDPSLIVLSGSSMQYDYLHDETVIAEMHKNMIKVGTNAPEIRVHKSGDMLWAQGAGALALEGITDTALGGLGRGA